MGDIGMLKGGLAWLLGGKGKVVNGVFGIRNCVGLRDDVGVRAYRKRRGGRKQYKYRANISNTEQSMLTCSARLPEDISKSFSYFRNLFGIILLKSCTIHLSKTGKKLHVQIVRGI
jgi:hypothetical protein